jgi:hypothetical protein
VLSLQGERDDRWPAFGLGVGQSIQTYSSILSNSPLWIWNDMFDPYQNAMADYYNVEGDLSGSWTGVPSNVIVLNWNLGDLRDSLNWFAGMNAQQPIPHQQIIAGYYDSGDGTGSAQSELSAASGIPGLLGLMYTSWGQDYSQLENFAAAVYANWPNYLASIASTNPILVNPYPPGGVGLLPVIPLSPLLPLAPVVTGPVSKPGSAPPAKVQITNH